MLFKNIRSIPRRDPLNEQSVLQFTKSRVGVKSSRAQYAVPPNSVAVETKPTTIHDRPAPFLKQMSIRNFQQRSKTHNVPGALPIKKLKWGPPIWNFLHTMAQKIKEEKFRQLRKEIIHLVTIICQNLPCPDCSNHASQYLREQKFSLVETKEQFKEFLYLFHNSVNMRKSAGLFQRNDLESTYQNNLFLQTWNFFIHEFSKKSHNTKMLANDFHRESIIRFLKSWIQQNLDCFDMA